MIIEKNRKIMINKRTRSLLFLSLFFLTFFLTNFAIAGSTGSIFNYGMSYCEENSQGSGCSLVFRADATFTDGWTGFIYSSLGTTTADDNSNEKWLTVDIPSVSPSVDVYLVTHSPDWSKIKTYGPVSGYIKNSIYIINVGGWRTSPHKITYPIT